MQPCEQKQVIESIQTNVSDLKGDIKELVSEFKDLARELRSSLVVNGQMEIRLQTVERDTNELWQEHRTETTKLWAELDKEKESISRCKTDDIGPLKEFKSNLEGKMTSLKAIPIICTIITVIVTVYNVFAKTPNGSP